MNANDASKGSILVVIKGITLRASEQGTGQEKYQDFFLRVGKEVLCYEVWSAGAVTLSFDYGDKTYIYYATPNDPVWVALEPKP